MSYFAAKIRRLTFPLVLTLIAGTMTSCRDDEPVTPKPNIVWICIDTLRPDHLSAYGYQRETSPHLEEVARQGVLFRNVFSQSPWTKPSVPSFFTSVYPAQHQVFEGSSEDREGRVTSNVLASDWLTAAEIFESAGYATGAFVKNAQIRSFLGFDQGFEVYVDEAGTAEQINDRFLEWLAGQEEPIFAYLHYLDVHWPYEPEPRFRELFPHGPSELDDVSSAAARRLRDRINDGDVEPSKQDIDAMRSLYDACIRQTDEAIERLERELKARGLDENTIWIITSDHGEEFYEHGKIGHGHSLRDTLLRIPLIMEGPGLPVGKTSDAILESIDLLPTLAELVGLGWPQALEGRSFAQGLAKGRIEDRPVFAEVLHGRRYERSVRTSRWKLIEQYVLSGPKKDEPAGEMRIAPGDRVDVRGVFEGDGVFVAEEIALEDGRDDDVEVRGPLTALDVESRRLTIGPFEITVPEGCSIRSHETEEELALADLAVGQVVEIDSEEYDLARRHLEAEKIERREDKQGDEVKLEAIVTAIDPDGPSLQMVGLEVVFEDDVAIPGLETSRRTGPAHDLTEAALHDPERYERTVVLYDLSHDSEEREDVAAEHPETVRELEQLLSRWSSGLTLRATGPESVSIGEAMVEELRRLGYVR